MSCLLWFELGCALVYQFATWRSIGGISSRRELAHVGPTVRKPDLCPSLGSYERTVFTLFRPSVATNTLLRRVAFFLGDDARRKQGGPDDPDLLRQALEALNRPTQ
jgi:hypothetical protein